MKRNEKIVTNSESLDGRYAACVLLLVFPCILLACGKPNPEKISPEKISPEKVSQTSTGEVRRPPVALEGDQRKVSQMSAGELRLAAEQWRGTHGDQCPTLGILHADDASDAWGNPFKIICEDDETTIVSAGPDKKPGTADDIRIPEISTARSGAAAIEPPPRAPTGGEDKLTFGRPTVKTMPGGMTMLTVEVTNKRTASITCTVTATFKKGDTILATANGAVNHIPPGGTKTAQLMSTGNVTGYDMVKLEPGACF